MALPITPKTCRQVIEEAKEYRQPMMSFRSRAYKEVTGRYYAGETGTGPLQAYDLRRQDHPDRPVAVLRHSAMTIRRILSHQTPTFEFGSELPPLNGRAKVMEMRFNKEAIENNFRDLGKNAILDALLSPVTVVRTGIRSGDEMFAASGRERDQDEWFARLVDGDCYFWDPDATNWDDRAWDAEEYLVPKHDLMDADIYDRFQVDQIADDVADTSSDAVRNLSGQHGLRPDSLVQMVRLVDMFFYDLTGQGNTIKVTFARHGDDMQFLYYGEYNGPTRGPFTRLVFDPIPHNVAALSSAIAQFEQARTVDELWARVQTQARKSTSKAVVPDGAPQDDVDAIKRDDAEMIRSDAAAQSKVLELNLVSQPLVEVATQAHKFANTAASNPDMLAGQSSDSKTATEFSGLMGMVQVNMKDMQETVEGFFMALARSWLWYELYHPARQQQAMTGTMRFPSGQNYAIKLSPQDKEGEFLDYVIKVRPGSSMYMDESIRSQREDQMIAKAMPLIQLEVMTKGFFRGSKFWQDRMMQLGADNMASYFGDPTAMMETMQQYAALGIQAPQTGQPQGGMPPVAGQPQRAPQEQPQGTKPIDQIRSANAEAVPA